MSSQSSPNQRIGRYELVAPIGRGGMARVYRARMQGPAGATKDVALKLLHAELSGDRDFVLMFLDEMRLAMALSHRNIVQTFDAGQASEPPFEGQYYLVMEMVEGWSLQQLLERLAGESARIPLDLALHVAMELCSALEYAHRHGEREAGGEPIVHRDVSPGNVLLSWHGDVKLADFGVAKAAGRLSTTQDDAIKGKLCYMAPEQARGEVGPASDLFALGAVLYEALSGQLLRKQPSVTALLKASETPAPRLSDTRPDLSLTLDQLVASCLAGSPARRPASAAALREALAQELFALQRAAGGAGVDAHGALRDYLGRFRPERALDQPSGRAVAPRAAGAEQRTRVAQAPREPADRLARALLDEAQGGPTTPGRAEAEASVAAPAPGDTTAARDADTRDWVSAEAPPGRRRRWGWVVLALLSLLAGLAAALWPTSPDAPPTRAPSRAPSGGVETVPLAPRGEAFDSAVGVADSGGVDAASQRTAASDSGMDAAGAAAAGATARPDGAPRRPRHRRGSGWLSINALPWARVYVDGRYRGETPLEGLSLPAGSYRVRLLNPDTGRSTRLRLRIVAGQTLRRVVQLPR